MFDLEKAIANWRRQMLATGIETPALLEELESHLREDIDHLMTTGNSAATAYQIAAARVGNPGKLLAEFKLARYGSSLPVVGLLTWTGLTAMLAVVLLSRWAQGKCTLLLTAHIFSLTTGYGTALLASGFGMYLVSARRRRSAWADQANILNRAIRWFTPVSAVLIVVGLLLGLLWSEQNRGYLLGSDPRAIGALCAAVCLAGLSLVQQFGLMNDRSLARLSLVGGLIVAVGWFGAGGLVHGYGIAGYWPLDLLVVVHLFFLGISTLPNSRPLET